MVIPLGFDYLRIILSVSVIAWHTIVVCYGISAETPYWTGPMRAVFAFILPSFFALSGFLVAGSLERNSLVAFMPLRGLRIFPALAVEIILSALIIGPLVTTIPLPSYFTSSTFYKYFFNLVGYIHYPLPGVLRVSQRGTLSMLNFGRYRMNWNVISRSLALH